MKKTLTRIMLIFGYIIPFVFLAMNEDVISGTLWFYLVMITGFGALSYLSAKSNNLWIVIVGNILSFLSSLIFTYLFKTEKWGWYFKPFTPYQSIIFETIILFAIQMIMVKFFIKKTRRTK